MQLAASSLHMLHRRVHGRGEKKSNSDLLQAGANLSRRELDVDPQRFHDVGGSTLRSHAAIAMFRDSHSGARYDESRGRRNIECAAGVTAGTTGVDERIAPRAAGVKNGISL